IKRVGGIQYQKGAEVNATNPLNYVGLGKVLWFKGKDADAKTQFFKATSLGPKNAEVLRRIAEAYITADNKSPDDAIKLLNDAIKLDPKNPDNFILMGDALLEKNPTDGGPPIKEYQKASDLNPKSPKGILRQGKLYQRGRNYQLALDLYKKAIELDPTFAPAYREIAEVYMAAGQNSKAIEQWKKYLELNNSNDARYRYFTALFKNKQYTEAIQEGEALQKKGYNSFYLERLLGYCYYEMGNKTDTAAYTKGLRAITKFFDTAPKDFKYLPTDYKYKGQLLSKCGKDSLGVVELEKAIALDAAANCELWADVARIWSKAKNYSKASAAWEKRTGCTKVMSGQDYFEFGRAYYSAAGAKQREAAAIKDAKAKQAKEAEALPLFVKADSCFSKLIQSNPTFPAGYFWKGRVEIYADPNNEKWLSKPYFEKAMQLVKPEEKTGAYKSNVIEALEYMGYYYVTTKDKEKADATFNELKTIDPNNEKAKNYFNPPKGAPQKK
ncbi:MAG: tetratricopeptide repeat protein, partial [Bacteroidia bacterium]